MTAVHHQPGDALDPAAYIVAFDEADPDAVDLLGGKGAGLARMTQSGFPVPPGYIISTEACRAYLASGAVPAGLHDQVLSRLAELETRTGKTFGAGPVPLLLSVRSGAPVSMPGMMDTILNLGLGREAAIALARATGDVRFMAESLLRFHRMYAETVLGATGGPESAPAIDPGADPAAVYDQVWQACEDAVREDVGAGVPADPREQLTGAVEAVFASWNTRRAKTYRRFHDIRDDLGTAVVVQAMVFGNLSDDSGSGVVFTRNPVTGEPGLFGEFLSRCQGEDVVAGTRTPDTIAEAAKAMPAVFERLQTICAELERQHADVLDIEFTIEKSALYLLQVRSAKRTPEAAVRIAADFLSAGVMGPARALQAVSSEQVRQVQKPGFDPDEISAARDDGRLLVTGIGACPGQASGALVLDPERAKTAAASGQHVILARPVTSPADLGGMIASQGIVTGTGGSTSHAAVVARALGRPCIVGCSAIEIDPGARTLAVAGRTLTEGEQVSVDGATGEVFLGAFAQSEPAAANDGLQTLLDVADRAAGCEVLSRVTLPSDVAAARRNGASGLVTAVDDLLAATGHLDELVSALLEQRGMGTIMLQDIEDVIAGELTGLLAEAGNLEVGVRAIDFLADEARELLQQTALITHYPQLSVPLGLPELVEAQLAGLARAARATGHSGGVYLAVRHISDPAEATALRALRDRAAARHPAAGSVRIGAYLTSPRGVFNSGSIAAASDLLWIEVRVLQAAVFGIPARQLLTQQPLEDYVRGGMLSTDPRHAIDPAVAQLLELVAAAGKQYPACPVGMRLSGAVAEQIATALYSQGFRRFAVDLDEIRPVTLAFGKAALSSSDP